MDFTKMRKLVNSDIFDNIEKKVDFEIIKCDKIRKYRMQKEFGEKKFIKP